MDKYVLHKIFDNLDIFNPKNSPPPPGAVAASLPCSSLPCQPKSSRLPCCWVVGATVLATTPKPRRRPPCPCLPLPLLTRRVAVTPPLCVWQRHDQHEQLVRPSPGPIQRAASVLVHRWHQRPLQLRVPAAEQAGPHQLEGIPGGEDEKRHGGRRAEGACPTAVAIRFAAPLRVGFMFRLPVFHAFLLLIAKRVLGEEKDRYRRKPTFETGGMVKLRCVLLNPVWWSGLASCPLFPVFRGASLVFSRVTPILSVPSIPFAHTHTTICSDPSVSCMLSPC